MTEWQPPLNLDSTTPTDPEQNPLSGVATDYPHGHAVLWARIEALQSRVEDLERQMVRLQHRPARAESIR